MARKRETTATTPPNELAKREAPDPPAEQVGSVFALIVSGASERQIVQAIEKLWPGTSPKPLIIAAMQKIAESGDVLVDTVRGWCVEATRHVYQKALAGEDYATALKAIKQLYELVNE